ncbi:hypothetical protein P4631_09265 [Halalkalibacterium halodurans]|uniref:hypothetical protein n=1 Tax=Halalkalibacterium halodurans TaxID=86665 RepID=UPI002E1EA358|nr:hypothetical protein [Halalkalibacterium halodurans]
MGRKKKSNWKQWLDGIDQIKIERVEPPKEDRRLYTCYLNGSLCGTGPVEYVTELFRDYVETRGMYGQDEATFTIIAKEGVRVDDRKDNR